MAAGDMGGHNAVGTPSGARRCSADGKIALGVQSQTSVRQAARRQNLLGFRQAVHRPAEFLFRLEHHFFSASVRFGWPWRYSCLFCRSIFSAESPAINSFVNTSFDSFAVMFLSSS